jgi:hypothetical protein
MLWAKLLPSIHSGEFQSQRKWEIQF